jgi:dienelactone hydrolase
VKVRWLLCAGAVAIVSPALLIPVAGAQGTALPTPSSPVVCDQPPGNPAPGSAAWEQRDLNNLECASQRQQDAYSNPAFLSTWAIENGEQDPGTATSGILGQLETERPTGAAGDVPSTKIGDPFRDPVQWEEEGRGHQQTLTIDATDGAHLNARLYSPNGPGPFPGVVMIPGLQAYNEVYEWLGEGLAEAGYMVLIPDPQGQGGSEDLPHNPDGSIACGASGCSDTSTNPASDQTQVVAVTSGLDFLLSTPAHPDPDAVGANAAGTLTYNPEWALLDPHEIGLAGHSNGAIAVTSAGQNDPRVKAVVPMDNLDGSITLAPGAKIHAPALYFGVDYAFPSVLEPMNPESPPNPTLHEDYAYAQTVKAGVDSMVIVPRASTHYEFDYLPSPASLQASRYGERVASYYILAWFDKYLDHNIRRDGRTGTQRLTAEYFDGSADASSIGAGTYNPAATAADPTNPAAGNVPYTIAGKCISNLLSFYYQSAYSLNGGKLKNYHMENPLGCS